MSDDFPAPGPRRPRGLPGMALAIGATLLAGAALWSLYDVRTLGERERALEQQVDVLSRHAEVLAAGSKSLSADLGTLTAGQANLAQRLDGLYGARRAGLLAAESEHLVRLAAQRLALMQDPAGALALLTAADAALADIRDADVHATRAALATDIATLRNASTLDVEALYLRLAALPPAVEQIAGAAARPGAATAASDTALAAPGQPASAWERLQATVMSLVSIRRVDTPLAPLVTAGERQLAAQNFALLVQQAQLALLQRRHAVYRHSLEQAGQWLDRIAAGEPSRRAAVRRELSSLLAVDVGERLPDLTASLGATRALAARLLPAAGGSAP